MPRTGQRIPREHRSVVARGWGREGMWHDHLMGMGFPCGVMKRFLHNTVSVLTATELSTSKMVMTVNKTSIDLLAHRVYALFIFIKTGKLPCKIFLLFSGVCITVCPFLPVYLSQFTPISVSPSPLPCASLSLSPCSPRVLFKYLL